MASALSGLGDLRLLGPAALVVGILLAQGETLAGADGVGRGVAGEHRAVYGDEDDFCGAPAGAVHAVHL